MLLLFDFPVESGPPPEVPAASVSGAGTDPVNGLYTERGMFGGKRYYNLQGEPDSTSLSCVVWDNGRWEIHDSAGVAMYLSVEEGPTTYPWESGYETGAGEAPDPTVSPEI